MSEHSPSRLPPNLPLSTVSEITSWLVGHTLESVERELVLNTLTHCSGNRFWAASILGIAAEALEEKLRGYAEQGFAVPADESDALLEEGEIEADGDAAEAVPQTMSERVDAEELPGQFHAGRKGSARWVAVAAAVAIVAGATGFYMAGGSETAPRVDAAVPEKPVLPPQTVAAPATAKEAATAQIPARAEPASVVAAATQREAEAEPGGETGAITAAIEAESTIELPLSAPLPAARPSPEDAPKPRVATRAARTPQAKDGEVDILRILFPFSNGRAAGPNGSGAGPDRPN